MGQHYGYGEENNILNCMHQAGGMNNYLGNMQSPPLHESQADFIQQWAELYQI
jgi:hypothetical protein